MPATAVAAGTVTPEPLVVVVVPPLDVVVLVVPVVVVPPLDVVVSGARVVAVVVADVPREVGITSR
jgi:hypothetical protein